MIEADDEKHIFKQKCHDSVAAKNGREKSPPRKNSGVFPNSSLPLDIKMMDIF